MAKIEKGIFGPLIGKHGPIIGSTWKGIPYLKIKASNASKARELSVAQKAHHEKFRFLTKWLQPLHPYVQVGYRNLAKTNTEINAAFAYHFKAALKTGATGFYMDYENVLLSQGRLKGIHQPLVSLTDENTLKLTWEHESHHLSMFNDQLMLVLYNDEFGLADGLVGGIKRSAKSCTFHFEQTLEGKSLHVFVAMISINGREISQSQYLGKIEPLW
jgi:hypothetical protein